MTADRPDPDTSATPTADLADPSATYLVTGGAGFIGSHLVETLVGAGATVRVLDDFSTGRRENLEPFLGHIELLEGSITDLATCQKACEGADYVFHEAALPSVQRSVADPLPTHQVNATGTLHMLMAARDGGAKRFVYAASSSAYGDTEVLPKSEDLPTRPKSPYAVAKLAGEQYVAAFAEVYDMPALSLRYFNIFGPRQDPTSQYSAVIPLFVMQAREGREPTINGDGEQTRDFTYVENAVRANLLACRAPEADIKGRVFNVGCGERTSVNTLWETIRSVTGTDVEAVHGPPRPGDVRDSLADLTRIRDAIGYTVQVPLDEGLRRTVQAMEAGG